MILIISALLSKLTLSPAQKDETNRNVGFVYGFVAPDKTDVLIKSCELDAPVLSGKTFFFTSASVKDPSLSEWSLVLLRSYEKKKNWQMLANAMSVFSC